MDIKSKIKVIRENIARSAEQAGRKPEEIALLGVTKTRTPQEIMEAAPWLDAIGENRVQEAKAKKQECSAVALKWHMIGHLQSNKARQALELFDTIDSINSTNIALTIERIASETGRTVPILIEVNTSGEDSKVGIAPDKCDSLIDTVMECKHLSLQGFMTIGPLTDNEVQVRKAFASLREVASRTREQTGLSLPVLSMGMSGDYEWAIQEGSTMIRLGTVIFGSR